MHKKLKTNFYDWFIRGDDRTKIKYQSSALKRYRELLRTEEFTTLHEKYPQLTLGIFRNDIRNQGMKLLKGFKAAREQSFESIGNYLNDRLAIDDPHYDKQKKEFYDVNFGNNSTKYDVIKYLREYYLLPFGDYSPLW